MSFLQARVPSFSKNLLGTLTPPRENANDYDWISALRQVSSTTQIACTHLEFPVVSLSSKLSISCSAFLGSGRKSLHGPSTGMWLQQRAIAATSNYPILRSRNLHQYLHGFITPQIPTLLEPPTLQDAVKFWCLQGLVYLHWPALRDRPRDLEE